MGSAASVDLVITRGARWPRRYTVVVLFALSTVLCYIDRVNISIAIIPLSRAHGYSDATRGIVLSAFFWGYLIPQLPGGWLADRFGGKRVLGAGVAIWSLATFFTPPAAASLGLLLLMRAMLGAGEGVNFPAIHSLAARWTPINERSRAISLHFSGVALGTVIALLATPPLILRFGWESVFYVSGALGILWLLIWNIKAADSPEDCAGVSAKEMAHIHAGRPDMPAATEIPWGPVLREKAVWAIVLAHLCNNFGFYILLLWLPSYLSHTFNVPLRNLGLMAVAPYIAAFAIGNASGWIADALLARGFGMTAVRKTLQTIAFAGGALALLAMPSAHTATVAVIIATLSAAATSLGMGGFGVNHLDVGPRYAGILMGLSNTFATIPGIIGVAATGFIVQATGSFSAAFYMAAAVYAIGMLIYIAWGSGEQKL